VRDYSNPMGSRLRYKVDLQKAFDTVNREFIYYIFHCMEFSHTWINWIKECISSAIFSIMLNGSPVGSFSSNRGTRQGCPLSPYLFVMGFWSITMDIAPTSDSIKPLRRNDKLVISNLLFADGMLVLYKGNHQSAIGINEALHKLQQYIGLAINKQKRKVFF